MHPDPAELPLASLYDGLTLPDPGDGRAWVALCMVSSVDGAVTVGGRSGGLGGEADLLALSRLRGSNDVSVVGAGTVRDEDYGPLTGGASRREDRARRGLTPVPRLAIVSASGAFDPHARVFADKEHRPLLLVAADGQERARATLGDRAEIHPVGDERLDARAVVDQLVDLGLRRIVCEGGPRLNPAMLDADLVDEVFLTLAPRLVGGPAARMIAGEHEQVRDLHLVSAFEHGGDLLLRYRHARHGDR